MRLTKTGHKGEAKYRLVVTERRYRRDGSPVEYLGWIIKQSKKVLKDVQMDRVKYWLSQGVRPSPTVKKILELA